MSEPQQTGQCINCDNEIEGEPVSGHGSLQEDALEAAESDEPVPVDEVFAFDDGPYCSLGCLLDEDGGRDE